VMMPFGNASANGAFLSRPPTTDIVRWGPR
jgi:hypothetical protein